MPRAPILDPPLTRVALSDTLPRMVAGTQAEAPTAPPNAT